MNYTVNAWQDAYNMNPRGLLMGVGQDISRINDERYRRMFEAANMAHNWQLGEQEMQLRRQQMEEQLKASALAQALAQRKMALATEAGDLASGGPPIGTMQFGDQSFAPVTPPRTLEQVAIESAALNGDLPGYLQGQAQIRRWDQEAAYRDAQAKSELAQAMLHRQRLIREKEMDILGRNYARFASNPRTSKLAEGLKMRILAANPNALAMSVGNEARIQSQEDIAKLNAKANAFEAVMRAVQAGATPEETFAIASQYGFGPAAPATAQIPVFNSEQEARAAGATSGSRVRIMGVGTVILH